MVTVTRVEIEGIVSNGNLWTIVAILDRSELPTMEEIQYIPIQPISFELYCNGELRGTYGCLPAANTAMAKALGYDI